MIVLDVETTGTNPDKHSLVSIGAINFLKPTEKFYVECQIWPGAHIDPSALDVNGFSEYQISDSSKISEREATDQFLKWVEPAHNHMIAGQNPTFDMNFIQAAANRNHLNFTLAHRMLDQHSVCYAHMIRAGIEPPQKNRKSDLDSDKIMAYVGIPTEPKPHIAINGAKWEAEAFSRLLFSKNLLDEFKIYPIPWI